MFSLQEAWYFPHFYPNFFSEWEDWKEEFVMNCSEMGLKLKMYLEILFLPRLRDCGGRVKEIKPQAADESSRRDSFPAERFTPSPVCQIRFPSRLFPRQAGSNVLVSGRRTWDRIWRSHPRPALPSAATNFLSKLCPIHTPFLFPLIVKRIRGTA